MSESTQIGDGVRAKAIQRRFIVITYDITNSVLRAHIARKLLKNGFARINLSVYDGIYSEALVNDITNYIEKWQTRYQKRGELVDVLILTPMYFGEEAQLVLDKFETKFKAQWDHIDNVFLRISRILDIDRMPGDFEEVGEEGSKKKVWQPNAVEFESLYGISFEQAKKERLIHLDRTDDTWGVYRGDQIMQMVKDIQYCISDLRQSLASRRKYESGTTTPEQLQNFDVLDQRLERDDSYLKELADRCARRSAREVKKDPNQTSLDQNVKSDQP